MLRRTLIKRFELYALLRPNWQVRKHGRAVAAAIKIDVVTKHRLHTSQPREFRWLIHPVRSLGPLIHFLERHDIRLRRHDYFRNPWKINLVIHPLAMTN